MKTIKDAPETLKTAILTIQEKLLCHREEFIDAPLTIEVEMGDGRYVERANPVVQEYRAMVRDFSSAYKSYKDISKNSDDGETNNLDSIRAKFKVAK